MPNLRIEILNIALSLICMAFIHRQIKEYGHRSDSIQERIGLFDALKGVCIIGVVFIHAAYLTPVSRDICRTLDFAVPFFFVSSGYLLSVRCRGAIALGGYFRKLFVRILLVYFLFVIGTRIFNGEALTLKDILLDILLGRTNYNYYFIPLILQFYILFPYLVRFKEKLDRPSIFCLIAFCSFFFYVCNHYIQRPYWNENPYYLVFIGRDFIYFCFGMFLSRYEIRKLRFADCLPSFMIFLAGVVVLVLATGEYILTFAYPFVAFLLALAGYKMIREQPWLFLLEDLGRYSLVVYLVHTSIQHTVVMKFLYNTKLPWEFQILVVVGATVALSYVFAWVFMSVYQPVILFFTPAKQPVAVAKKSGD
jgi:probable poly-beta-1,6-N-acetyl-D-glucosamine export protein